MNFRKAKTTDITFIIKCIIESEKSNSEIFPYQSLFGLDEGSFTDLMSSIFEEEIEDQPWFLDYWYICEVNQAPAAGCCGWVESVEGVSSDMLKTQILSALLGNKFHENLTLLKEVSKISIPRKPGTLQLEHLYTEPTFRGTGCMRFLLQNIGNNHTTIQHEIQLLQNNVVALEFYQKIGFNVVETQCNPEILRLNLLGDSCKVKMARIFS